MKRLCCAIYAAGCLSGCATTSNPDMAGSEQGLATAQPAAQPLAAESIVCADQWVACGVQPVGSLIQSAEKRPLTAFFKASCTCGQTCGCVNGLASGEGFARWCDTSSLCESHEIYGAVSGRLNQGQYVAQHDKTLVSINSARGVFRGTIHNDGTYAVGMLAQPGKDEQFFGRLDSRGFYQSGALYLDGKIIIANRFDGKEPLGRVLIGDATGNFAERECDKHGCQDIKTDHDESLKNLFGLLAENKMEDAVTSVQYISI